MSESSRAKFSWTEVCTPDKITEQMTWLGKGYYIKASWMKPKLDPPACLAGVQLKFEAEFITIEGIVRHIRGDHPTRPTETRLYVEHPTGTMCAKCGVLEIEVDPKHVTEILSERP